jgi:adenosylmethionine-8-amino-7-oxononanoate aminotransferase
MSSVLHRALNATLPTVVGGEGNYLIDHEGKRYLDACGGAAVSCLGHDNERIRTALKAQIDRIAFAHTSFFTNEPAELLARFLGVLDDEHGLLGHDVSSCCPFDRHRAPEAGRHLTG